MYEPIYNDGGDVIYLADQLSKENDLYDKLQSKLDKETFDEFQEFLMLYADRYSSYQEFAFNQGVKLGFSLAKELEDIEI
jgi:hypothetical protein